MKLRHYSLRKILGVFLLSLVLMTENAYGFSLFQQKRTCEGIHLSKSSRQLVYEINLKNQNFLGLPDFADPIYVQLRETRRKQLAVLEKVLSNLNLERKYTDKQKMDWAQEVVTKLGDLVGGNEPLRQRAQTELLTQGLNEYLQSTARKYSFTSEALYKIQRFTEIVFDNHLTRWAGFPLWLPQIRYKDLGPELLKKIIFEGYNKNEAEVMKALKETNRIAAFNKFSAIYRKIIVIAALVVVPMVSYFSVDKSMEQMSDSTIHQVTQAEKQSQVLKDMDWSALENSLIYIHSKQALEDQVGRPLMPAEIAELQKVIAQKPAS